MSKHEQSQDAAHVGVPEDCVGVSVRESVAVGDWEAAAQVLQVLRPTLEVGKFIAQKEQLERDGYRLVVAWAGKVAASVASFTLSPHAMLGRELLIHDMATCSGGAGRGYGTQLVKELCQIAKREGCGRVFVHTRNAAAFYEKNNFEVYSTGLIFRVQSL